MINNQSAKVVSNLMFLAPAVIALYKGSFFHTFLILMVFASSMAYHFSKEKKYYFIDLICALSLISFNIYILIINSVSIYVWVLIVTLVLISFYYKYIKSGDNYQWHILSALITLFVVSV